VLTRILCVLLRHPLVSVAVHDEDPGGAVVVIAGQRCRCARRVESVRVYGGQFPRRRA
jgi:hypothetical protein